MRTLKSLLLRVRHQRALSDENEDTFGHPIFEATTTILDQLESLSFDKAKDIIGFSLREDYASSIISAEDDLRVGVDDDLPQVVAPYITTPIVPSRKYTLVLDLDETLVHYFEY